MEGRGLNQCDEYTRRLGIVKQMPQRSEYVNCTKRSRSFVGWPHHMSKSSDGLAKCGLFYTGDGDCVRCYYCGGDIRNWEAHDDPWVKHITAFPDCPHVLLNKGQRYIDIVRQYGDRHHCAIPTHHTGSFMGTVAAQTCLQMGFSEERIRKAIEKDPSIQDDDNSTVIVHNLCELLLDGEEDVQQRCSQELMDTSAPVQPVTTTETATLEEARTQIDSPSALYEENCRLKEHLMCKICLDGPASIVFLSCGHLVTCPQCAPVFRTCPICRGPITGYVRAVFASSERETFG